MKKKISILGLLISILAICLFMTACGGSDADNDAATDQTDAEVSTDTGEDTSAESLNQVLVDNEYITITLTNFDFDGFYGPEMKVLVENKSDRDIMVSIDDVSVNGFMLDPFWATTISAGKSANESIEWFDSDVEENGITSFETVECTFTGYDDDNYDDLFDTDTITINF